MAGWMRFRFAAPIPVAAFALVFGGSLIWFSLGDEAATRSLEAGRRPRIAFVRDGHVAVMDADGRGPVRVLTNGELKDSHPQWSPDGERILFTRDPGDVLVVKADGRGLARVPLDGLAGGASWQPEL
jgi:hypothetical protein